MRVFIVVTLLNCYFSYCSPGATQNATGLRIAMFDVDATPQPGMAMAFKACERRVELSLRCRGIVLLGADAPIVLCAVDWLGIGNEGHDAFRAALANAAGIKMDRVAVHTLHQHDAPICDFGAEKIMREEGLSTGPWNGDFARDVIQRAAVALRECLPMAEPVTHVGFGEARVDGVASNRRIKGPEGRVRAVRYSKCSDPALRAEPEGVIDPVVSCISFWNDEKPLAVLSYYACHPQSYYGTTAPSPDFPGIARFMRGQSLPEALHVHFNGAGGNIAAGKYNDGGHDNRMILALRLADGMKRAFDATQKTTIMAADVTWRTEPVALQPAPYLDEVKLREELKELKDAPYLYLRRADRLAFLLRCKAGHRIDIGCLKLGSIRVLHMPGELFVEYQLAAKAARPDLHISMAAYGDYGPAYIGTATAYNEGGYETSGGGSSVGPQAEGELMRAIRKLLE